MCASPLHEGAYVLQISMACALFARNVAAPIPIVALANAMAILRRGIVGSGESCFSHCSRSIYCLSAKAIQSAFAESARHHSGL